jgi:hypothetical protein
LKGSVQRVKRTFVAVALAVIFVLALAAPAMAQLYHTVDYETEGVISFKKQAGHWCNTGAEIKQTIAGSGKMDKVQTITQIPGKITMDDTNDWVAGATPLTVTTVWKLCTPAKYTYDVPVYGDVPVGITAMYPRKSGYNMPASVGYSKSTVLDGTTMDGYTVPMLAKDFGWDALTEQYWAVQVQADPGFSGNIHQKGEAAYGGFWSGTHDYDALWESEMVDKSGTWRWEENKDGDLIGASVGANYVGDYFNMQQMARTSQGTLKRYIDISSPWSHGYLHEDMSVVGKSMITEAFKLTNLSAGADVPGDWWRLF